MPLPLQNADVNQLIFEYAEHNRPADMQRLIVCLLQTELFAPVTSGMPKAPNATKYVTDKNDLIQIMTVRLSNLECVIFFTDQNDARLSHDHISMTGKEAFQMVLKAKAGGIVIQNSKNSYFGLDAQGIRELLEKAEQDAAANP